jgi:hypothetical protein
LIHNDLIFLETMEIMRRMYRTPRKSWRAKRDVHNKVEI